MRILLLIPSMEGFGGTERVVSNLARLLAADHEVHVASFDSESTSPHYDVGVPFHPLGEPARLSLALRPFTYAQQARRLAALKRRLRVELTISNLWRADLVNALSGGDDRKIALCHTNVMSNSDNATMLQFLIAVRAIYRRFDKVVAVNEALRDELARLYRLDAGKITFIDNFVEIPSSPEPVPCRKPDRFVWCGRFAPVKNLAALIDIFAGIRRERPGAKLALIGTGPDMQSIKDRAMARDMRISTEVSPAIDADVEFAGALADPLPEMRRAHMMLLTSTAEGLPMTLLEAISLGLPVAASDCPAGGISSLMAGSASHDPRRSSTMRTSLGLLLPVPRTSRPSTIAAWVSEITALFADEAALAAMHAGAIRRSLDFTPAAVRPKWLSLIDDVCSFTPSAAANITNAASR